MVDPLTEIELAGSWLQLLRIEYLHACKTREEECPDERPTGTLPVNRRSGRKSRLRDLTSQQSCLPEIADLMAHLGVGRTRAYWGYRATLGAEHCTIVLEGGSNTFNVGTCRGAERPNVAP